MKVPLSFNYYLNKYYFLYYLSIPFDWMQIIFIFEMSKLTINKEYAMKYDKWRAREELQKSIL